MNGRLYTPPGAMVVSACAEATAGRHMRSERDQKAAKNCVTNKDMKRVFQEKYEIIRPIGEGAMGEIFEVSRL